MLVFTGKVVNMCKDFCWPSKELRWNVSLQMLSNHYAVILLLLQLPLHFRVKRITSGLKLETCRWEVLSATSVLQEYGYIKREWGGSDLFPMLPCLPAFIKGKVMSQSRNLFVELLCSCRWSSAWMQLKNQKLMEDLGFLQDLRNQLP